MPQYFLDKSTYQSIEYGYLAIFKRSNLTSAEELESFKAAISTVSNKVKTNSLAKDLYQLRVGHGGCLDKIATGVLAVGLCKGCKMLKLLLGADKEYTVTARLGLATDSFDRNGMFVDECSYEHVTRAMIEENLKRFIGPILQRPPLFSALKYGGKRMSDIARMGKAVEMRLRPVMCYDVQCIDFKPPYFKLEIKCGKGFYVRSLISDLTKALGSCGYVTDLQRTRHGQFTLDDCLQAVDYTATRVVEAVQQSRDKFPMYAKALE